MNVKLALLVLAALVAFASAGYSRGYYKGYHGYAVAPYRSYSRSYYGHPGYYSHPGYYHSRHRRSPGYSSYRSYHPRSYSYGYHPRSYSYHPRSYGYRPRYYGYHH